MSNMSNRITHPEGGNTAPSSEGRTDFGYDNLKVALLHYPSEDEFKFLMTKAAKATRGGSIDDEEIDEVLVADLFKGGLNQCLEWMTVVFEVEGVSRGVTHQLVRTRKASFAQQSMRYADMGSFNARMPVGIANAQPKGNIANLSPRLREALGVAATPKEVWEYTVQVAREAYAWLAEEGIDMQDARTVCPIATETYIICEYPLSEFLALYSYRACQMFYPEMVALMGLMKEELLAACPWLTDHLKISCEKTSGGIDGLPHRCTYQGFERVEGQCTFEWALEENRVYKSKKVLK